MVNIFREFFELGYHNVILDGDVSLASVAKDLGINSDALNEVLASAQVGEDEPMDCDDDDRLIGR